MIKSIPLLILILLGVMILLAPYFAPFDPLDSNDILLPPSSIHLFGTDAIGRDIFSRVLYGGQRTLSVAFGALILSVLPGLILGLIAGYIGGVIDSVITALLDALLAFPTLLLALSILALVGSGAGQVALAVGITGMPSYARVIRAAAMGIRSRLYVEAARAGGATPIYILWRHILPNITETAVSFAIVILGWAILNAATLNFLGFSGDPSVPEWGVMLAEGRMAFRVAPWVAFAPGAAIMITLLAIQFVAERIISEG